MNNLTICHYCKEEIKKPTKDHVFPKSKIRKILEKGEELPEELDLENNIVIACLPCNTNKGTNDYDAFISLGLTEIRHKKRMFLNNQYKDKRVIRKYRKRRKHR